ncbi:MAG TPA: GNAT family N-acetyltransferase [Thermoplasmata archaeon]|nr:GNAT family N-acetyltransferase [Thermoplasmata archaeon]
MRIREGTPDDVDALRRIARASFDRIYAFFAVRGVRAAWPYLIADQDGIPAGFLIGRWFDGTPPIGYVYFIAVDATFRRQGIARTLVVESLNRFARRGATRVFAAVTEENAASLGLFASLGFTKAPRRALWRWYGWRGLSVEIRMVLAPHEALLVRTFTDPSPEEPQGL